MVSMQAELTAKQQVGYVSPHNLLDLLSNKTQFGTIAMPSSRNQQKPRNLLYTEVLVHMLQQLVFFTLTKRMLTFSRNGLTLQPTLTDRTVEASGTRQNTLTTVFYLATSYLARRFSLKQKHFFDSHRVCYVERQLQLNFVFQFASLNVSIQIILFE